MMMRNRYCLVLTLALYSSLSYAQSHRFAETVRNVTYQPVHYRTAVSTAAAPRMAWTRTKHDFGYVKVGEIKNYSFVFTNTGMAPVQIMKVVPSSRNAAGSAYSLQVRQGQRGKVQVSVRPHQPGPFTYYIRINTNSKGLVHILTVSGIAY